MAARKGFEPEEPDEFDPDTEEILDEDEYVPAIVARNDEEAQSLQALLIDHDIPAVLAEQDPDEDEAPLVGGGEGIPVLVPQSMLDEAMDVIADRTESSDLLLDEEFEDDEEDEEDGLSPLEDEGPEDEFEEEDQDDEEDEEL